MQISVRQVLADNDYPGRGLLVARTPADGLCIVYFMTGRSAASRERTLVLDGASLYARPRGVTEHDPLRHYRAATIGPAWCVVGNGDQVDTVITRLATMEPATAVQGIAYEPDPPLRTPRITVVASRTAGGPMLIAGSRASVLAPEQTYVSTLTVGDVAVGSGILTTTYLSQDRHVVSTHQPPSEVTVAATDAETLLELVWSSLADDLRVAAAVVLPTAAEPLVADLLRSA
ncbi:IMP cyclohydrolase [Microlunatus parietis]|uniref:IMP cyclohydrolase n=1 Tax=Microlunatus parietis TaxID=682979 RepID=A0A7Y9I225_9ACTN|nr:IMP cyclohydrolase [Microlunatus parietis]NYE68697.1 IMP cyclohydrolase [Microlunatus parietis]